MRECVCERERERSSALLLTEPKPNKKSLKRTQMHLNKKLWNWSQKSLKFYKVHLSKLFLKN